MSTSHRSNPPPTFNPYRRFGLLTLFVTLLIAFGLMQLFPIWDRFFNYLIAVNVVTLAAFGYDKLIAPTQAIRVPEAILLALTALGGCVGGIIARPVFRHKTRKASFQLAFWFCVLISIVLIAIYYLGLCPACR
jgi:uncharacterized membrane protein YsdA (DUF1294 family)